MSDDTGSKTVVKSDSELEHKRKHFKLMLAYFTGSIIVITISLYYSLATTRIAVQRPPEVQVAEYAVGAKMQDARIAEANVKIAQANVELAKINSGIGKTSRLRVIPVPALNPTNLDLMVEEGVKNE